jgi:hypothetical protein
VAAVEMQYQVRRRESYPAIPTAGLASIQAAWVHWEQKAEQLALVSEVLEAVSAGTRSSQIGAQHGHSYDRVSGVQ